MAKFQIAISKVLTPEGYFLIVKNKLMLCKLMLMIMMTLMLMVKLEHEDENGVEANVDLFYFQVQEARGQHDDEAVKRAINEYEDTLGRYIPVLMAQAKIYWELEMYQQVRTKLILSIIGAA